MATDITNPTDFRFRGRIYARSSATPMPRETGWSRAMSASALFTAALNAQLGKAGNSVNNIIVTSTHVNSDKRCLKGKVFTVRCKVDSVLHVDRAGRKETKESMGDLLPAANKLRARQGCVAT